MKGVLAVIAIVVAAFLVASWLRQREQETAADEQAAEADRTGIDAPSEHGLYDCTCDYLTDTDLGGEERVRVCADGGAEAVQRGRGCAARHSPGTVNACSCLLWSKVDCELGDCRQNR